MYHRSLLAIALFGALGIRAAPSTIEARKASPQCWYGNFFPAESDWLSFEDLFNKWSPEFRATGNTEQELAVMKESLQSFSAQGSFNPALATAMMIQESGGNTCSKCGDQGLSCGLLQVHGSAATCADQPHPCPSDAIRRGIECGTVGCTEAYGSNIKGCLASQQQNYGAALRCYNTGSVPDPNNLRVATWGDPTYVHRIANILLGADWATIDGLTGSQCGF